MFTTGSKWFLGLGLASLVMAAAYGWTTGGSGLGPITAGYNGGIGDHLGYTLLLGTGVVSVFLGLLSVGARDADPRALAQLAGTDVAPSVPPPAHLAYWPIVGAFGSCLVVLGLVISNVLFIVGFAVLLVVLVEWMVLAWSDRATGDPATNRVVRNRLMAPYEVPLAGIGIAGGTVLAFSRVFLTSSELGAVGAAIGLGSLVFIVGIVLATRPKLSANVVAGLLAVVAIGVVTLGVVAAARGERVIEPHEEGHDAEPAEQVPASGSGGEHSESEDPATDSGIRPHVPAGTQRAVTTTTEAAG